MEEDGKSLDEQLSEAREKLAKGEVDPDVLAMVQTLRGMLHGDE